jgi:hypothetical protein
VGYVALFLALNAGAYAVTAAPKNSVRSKSIKNGQVKTKDLADESVDEAKLAQSAITTPKLGNGAVTNPKLANSSVDAANVQSNSLTGGQINESSLRGVTRRLIWNAPAGAPQAVIARVGPYALKARCFYNNALISNQLDLTISGFNGSADASFVAGSNDGTPTPVTKGVLVSGPNAELDSIGAQPGDFRRHAGTIMLRSGSTLLQLDFNAVSDNRTAPGRSCFIYGTATLAN